MRNIIDVSTFTDPVTVLEDGDSVDQAHTQPTIQALANRTRNAKNRLDQEHNADGTHAVVHADRIGVGGAIPGSFGQVAAGSLSLSSNASVGGQVSASDHVAGGANIDDSGLRLQHGLSAFAPIGASAVFISAGGNQDLDLTLGHTYQQFLVDIQINTGGISPIITTLKFAPPPFYFGFVLARVHNVALSDSSFSLKNAGSGSFTPFRSPNGAAFLTWNIAASEVTQLLLLLRIVGSAYGSFCELVSSNIPY